MGFKKAMVKRNQELIDQFNREEERHRQLQWLKEKNGSQTFILDK